MHKFKGKKEQIKLVLDMSNDGPTFKMLENLMAATAGGKSGKGGGEHAKAVLSKPFNGCTVLLGYFDTQIHIAKN